MNRVDRVDRRELIFMEDADCRRFVKTLGEACAKTGWEVHACVLIQNHLPVPSTADRFSSGDRDAAAQSGRRDEMVAGHLTQSIQPVPQAVRPALLRSRLKVGECRRSQQNARSNHPSAECGHSCPRTGHTLAPFNRQPGRTRGRECPRSKSTGGPSPCFTKFNLALISSHPAYPVQKDRETILPAHGPKPGSRADAWRPDRTNYLPA